MSEKEHMGGVGRVLPEGGAVVQQEAQQEAQQLGGLTVGVGPHGAPAADRQQSSTAPVSGP